MENKNCSYSALTTLPVVLLPNTVEFKRLLLKHKNACIHEHYQNGDIKTKIWKATRFTERANVIHNVRSRPEYRQRAWQELGLVKVVCEVPNE